MADYDSLRLVPQKRSIDQIELSTHWEAQTNCFSGHAKKFPRSESCFDCQVTCAQWGVSEARRSSAADISSIPGVNQAEVIKNDKPKSEFRAYPELSSPGPIEICYGCVCCTIPCHDDNTDLY